MLKIAFSRLYDPIKLFRSIRNCIILFPLFFHHTLTHAQQAVEDSLNKIISQNKNEADVAKAYNGLAYEYSRKDAKKSRAYLNAAIAISKKNNDSKRLSSSYGQLVYLFHDAGMPDSAEYYLNAIKTLTLKANESEKDALLSNYYVTVALYYKRTGANQKAIPYFEKAIKLFFKLGDKESTAGQMLNLGNTYTILGNYQKATEQHLKSLRLFEEINNQRGISFCYQGLSNSFAQLKQYNQALFYANKSLKIKTTLNDRRGLGTAYSGLGNIYLGLNDFEKALKHFTEGLNFSIEQKNLPEAQKNYFNIAKVYAAKKELKQAIEFFTKSKELAKQLNDNSSVTAIDAEIISVQNNSEEIILEENKLKKTIKLFKEEGDLNRQVTGYKNMADFYMSNKQFEKALEYTNKYHQAIDSIQNNDLQLQVRKMEEQYNVEKKDKEITLLKKDKEIQQQKLQQRNLITIGSAALVLFAFFGIWLLMNRNKLRHQMKELELRNQIAADLHDEVGSSLSSIHMLSQMATQQTNEATHKEILTRMSSNAKETIDKMGDIVWMVKSFENEGSSLKQRMERFAHEICSIKNIETVIELDELATGPRGEKVKLSMEQRKNFYLIFKEALNNAVKYSGTKKIVIKAIVQNQELKLVIVDYGKGFETGIVGRGNGLENMKQRATDMKGIIQIDSEIGIGTIVTLKIPV